ncbi:hypothetical protein J6590_096855 [Homalodisca vitripennis]|nr:hypothetical protein J6590_068271 [Homalodisca vitripennis]KAG8250668.1 hypothetical protein J6590_096855 [Homalodisca vitripennis]
MAQCIGYNAYRKTTRSINQPACPVIGGSSEVTFKPLVPTLSIRKGILALRESVPAEILKDGLELTLETGAPVVPEEVDLGVVSVAQLHKYWGGACIPMGVQRLKITCRESENVVKEIEKLTRRNVANTFYHGVVTETLTVILTVLRFP